MSVTGKGMPSVLKRRRKEESIIQMTDERTKEALKELAAKQQRDFEESFKRAEIQTQINNMSLIEKAIQREEMIKRLNENARQILERDRMKAQQLAAANEPSQIDKTLNLQGKIIQSDPTGWDTFFTNRQKSQQQQTEVKKGKDMNDWDLLLTR